MQHCGYDHCNRPARPYLCGPRCTNHTPAHESNRPEPPPLAGRPWWIDASGHPKPLMPISTSWVHDTRAVASGRRASASRRRIAHAGEAYDRTLDGGAL